MTLVDITKWVDIVYTKVGGNLQSQYLTFRVMYWVDIILAILLALLGSVTAALLLGILGVVLGVVSNQKLVLLRLEAMNNENRDRTKSQLAALTKIEKLLKTK